MGSQKATIGLLALTAFLAVALLGAGRASATVLCEAKEEACVGEHWYQAPTAIKSEGVNPMLEGGLFTEKCTKSTLNGETTEETEVEKEPVLDSEGPLIGKFTELTATGCSPCTTFQAANLPYKSSLVFSKTVGNGTWTVESSGKGNPRLKFSGCPFGVSCAFGAAKLPLNVTGGNPATAAIEGAAFTLEEGSKALCGEAAKLTASFSLTSPKPAFVGRGRPRTRLCKSEPTIAGTELVCPTGTLFAGVIKGFTTEPTTWTGLSGPVGSVTCEESIFKGAYAANGSGTLESLLYQDAGGTPCKGLFEFIPTTPEVEMKLLGLPSVRSLFSRTVGTAAPQGSFLTTTGGGGINITLEMKILGESATKCEFRITSGIVEVTNGAGAVVTKLVIKRQFQQMSETPVLNECPSTMKQTNNILLTQANGEDVYIANR